MSKISDNHTHFTGSLPLEFIWQNIRRRKLPLRKGDKEIWGSVFKSLNYNSCLKVDDNRAMNLFSEFKSGIESMFNGNPALNLMLFFQIYGLFQYWTKTDDIEEMADLYYNGTLAIVELFHKDGVSNFEIIAGPTAEWGKTKVRFDSMLKAIEDYNRKHNLDNFGQIRITFIRNVDKKYFNYSPKVLELIIQEIDNNPVWERRISGFDFSGVEVAREFDIQSEILIALKKYNDKRQRKNKKRFLMSCHAGEDVINNKAKDLNAFFDDLLKHDVNRICHGTYLWIPKKYLDVSEGENKRRNMILYELAKRNIELEICPTANILLSSLRSYSEIPLKKLDRLGVKYTINTDNKTIFSTNIFKEYKHVNLPAK